MDCLSTTDWLGERETKKAKHEGKARKKGGGRVRMALTSPKEKGEWNRARAPSTVGQPFRRFL